MASTTASRRLHQGKPPRTISRNDSAICVLDESIRGESVKLSTEEQKRVRDVFDAYDYDGSGRIDRTEMRELFEELKWNVDQHQLDDFLANVFGEDVACLDHDMLTAIYKALLAKQATSVRKEQSIGADASAKIRRKNRINVRDLRVLEADLRSLFNDADKDRSGYLCVPEMRSVLRSSGLPDPDGDGFETAVHEHMRVADKNADGKISFEEFLAYRNGIIDYCYGVAKKEEQLESTDLDVLRPLVD